MMVPAILMQRHKLLSLDRIKGGGKMAWTYELTQQRNQDGELIPLWIVTQWNTDNPNIKYETMITEKVKDVCYGN
jgi:hypothetical protein